MKAIYRISLGVLIAFFLVGSLVHAQERDLYIGDIITIEINTLAVSEADIRESFKDFTIQELERTDTGYRLTVSSLEVGDYPIVIGNQDLVIQVHSTLEAYANGDIYEGDMPLRNHTLEKVIPYVILASGALLLISLLVMLIRFIKGRQKHKPLTPYDLFYNKVTCLDLEDKNSLGYMTKAFKVYCSSLYNKQVIGLSTEDFVLEMKDLTDAYQAIGQWSTDCDAYKYRNVPVSPDTIGDLQKRLIDIASGLQ